MLGKLSVVVDKFYYEAHSETRMTVMATNICHLLPAAQTFQSEILD